MLHILCGKMASGKSTLSKKLRDEHDAILISEDIWLSKLYEEEIHTLEDYIKYSNRLKEVLFGHIQDLLMKNFIVVLDFPGNTPKQRAWFRKIFETVNVKHTLHYVVASDERCKIQLKKRNKERPKGSRVMIEEEFDAVTAYFQAPKDEEGFVVKTYENEELLDVRSHI